MKEIITAVLLLVAVIVVAILFGIDMDYEKSKCLEEGGKWVSGVIGGERSFFCMPK
jgi:Na+(H+)/acetate symporter ActP